MASSVFAVLRNARRNFLCPDLITVVEFQDRDVRQHLETCLTQFLLILGLTTTGGDSYAEATQFIQSRFIKAGMWSSFA